MNYDQLINFFIQMPAILIVITIHEFTKAATSTLFGDVAPKNDKRLTLNPFKHFEPIGFIFILLLGFGWGKPVRTSGVYYKNRKFATIITYTMPIIVNLIFAFLFVLVGSTVNYFQFQFRIMPSEVYEIVIFFIVALIRVNISIAIFNLIPVAPLCGNKIVMALMSPNEALKMTHYEKIFQIILVFLLGMGLISKFIDPIINEVLMSFKYISSLILF